MAASPSVTCAIGRPSSTLFEKMPPMPNTDCDTPSRRNTVAATKRPAAYTTRQPPKYAMRMRASTRGSREKSLISRNSSAGIATVNTKRVNASVATGGQRPKVVSA